MPTPGDVRHLVTGELLGKTSSIERVFFLQVKKLRDSGMKIFVIRGRVRHSAVADLLFDIRGLGVPVYFWPEVAPDRAYIVEGEPWEE